MLGSEGIVRRGLRIAFRRIVGIYFRDIEVRGEVPHEGVGGRLFAGNHVNALIDPILVLTQAPCAISPIAKSTLWKIPGLRWILNAADAVPIVRRRDDPTKSAKDNDAVFERVAAHLAGGGNILIFPEGTSHNEPHLLALRSGAGRMLARAREEGGAVPLTFQAVALEFDARDVFRSRTLVLFGPVRRVDEIESEDLAQAITNTIRDDLSELLVEGATWEERDLLLQIAEMFANDARERSLEGRNRLGRRIEQARRVLSPDVVSDVEERVRAYKAALEDSGATDEDVARFVHRHETPTVAPERLARAAALVLVLPLALAGMIVYWLPYQLPRAITQRLKGDPDTASTYKLGVGLLVHPLWAAIGIALAFAKLSTAEASLVTALLVTSPFAALAWLDRSERLAARVRVLVPSEERRERFAALGAARIALMSTLEAARVRAEGA